MVTVDVSLSPGLRLPLARARVEALARHVLRAERVRDAVLSLAFVTAREIAALNRRHLGRRGATDVISFDLGAPGGGPLVGDVYIAPEVARENARRHGVAASEELARLVVHGLLHALGHDHPEGDGRTTSAMWRRQERLLTSARRAGVLA